MPQPTKPQLAIYAACAIAVLLIGARFLRSGEAGAPAGAGSAGSALVGGVGAPDGASGGLPDPAGGAGGAGDGGPGGAGAADVGAAVSGDGLGAGETAVVVDVKGAVRRPGVYRLATGARVLDAVERAGGLSGRADRRGVNLAARVTDGGEVIVPRRGERVVGGAAGGAGVVGGAAAGSASGATGGSAAGAAGDGAAAAPLALDINTATAQELELLDGVGPATAAKIVAYREQAGGFRSIEELDAVSGIGEAKLAAIRAQLGR